MSEIVEQFLSTGYVKFKNHNPEGFYQLQSKLMIALGANDSTLEETHKRYDSGNINPIRIKAFNELNSIENWRDIYCSMFLPALTELIGTELSIQNKLNLSVQMPNDESSVLPIHTDRAGGQSLFELVAWCSYTSNSGSECMYVIDPKTSIEIHRKTGELEYSGLEKVLDEYQNKVVHLDVEAGDCILFSGNLLHGNFCNEGNRTRVSTNTRFKSLWAPEYKKINNERITGSFYEPLNFSPSSEFALRFLNNGPRFDG